MRRWFRNKQNPVSHAGNRHRRRWWRLWVIAADATIIGLILASQHWPWLKLQSIETIAPPAWVKHARSMVVMPPDSNLLGVDVRLLESRLSDEFGALAECRARIVPPSTLRIRLRPFSPVLWTETGGGLMTTGEYVEGIHGGRDVPVWRPGNGPSREDGDCIPAVAAWTSVLRGDARFEDVVSEWRCDPATGWEMVIGDGQTHVILGWFDLTARAARVSRLLEQPDSLLLDPCIIDARFDRRLIVRPQTQSRRWTGYTNGAGTHDALAGRLPDRPGGGT